MIFKFFNKLYQANYTALLGLSFFIFKVKERRLNVMMDANYLVYSKYLVIIIKNW